MNILNKIFALFVLVIAALAAFGGTITLLMNGDIVLALANVILAVLAYPSIKNIFNFVFNDD